ncbi:hypothetical protein LTR10_010581 [Elasticomyces elasticus]|nr:hypothetical protein LTR10_010581 [Elasticomyces elasticus]KAK4972479.1 hypothetical protein LTR42_006989 [Elasticomyces elasticus]
MRDTKIHFGCYASGNAVMKSGHRRDLMVEEDTVIGFEMEGAGAWEKLPTIVVKGVVDYADSHKNKQWRRYPAARAALCVAAMIQEIDLPDRPHSTLSSSPVKGAHQAQSLKRYVVQPPQIIPHRMAHTQYTGYEHLLKELECHIPLTKSKQDYQTKIVLLGMGGIGKSEMVLQLIKKNRSTLDDRDRLARLTTPALLVFDNCDDESVDYGSYIPDNILVTVVLTTRLRAARKYASHDLQDPGKEHFMHLEGLEPSSATDLLMKVSATAQDDGQINAVAGNIVASLGFHPLAINVASSAIRENIFSIEEYASALEGQLMGEVSLAQKVNATFNVSARALARSTDQSAQDALRLLDLLAFMHHQGVSEDIFERAWKYEDTILSWFKEYEVDLFSWYDDHDEDVDGDKRFGFLSPWHVANCRRFLTSHPLEKRMHAFRTARAHLARLSLITFDAVTKSISLHLLISAWAKQRLEQPYKAWSSAACVLALSTEGSPSWQSFSSRLYPHIETNLSRFADGPQSKSAVSHRRQLCRIWYCYTWLLYRASSPLTLKCCQRLVKQTLALSDTGPDENELAEAQYLMGLVYMYNGQPEKALGPLKRVVRLRRSLAEDHSVRLVSESTSLAKAYLNMGQVAQAIALLEHLVGVEKTLAEDHPDQIASQYTLASAYFKTGQAAEAVELLEHVVRVCKRRPEDHPNRLASQHNLGAAYLYNGQIAQAVASFEYVVSVQEAFQAVDHPDRLRSQRALASAYLEHGQVAQAVELLEHVMQVEGKKLAESNPARLASQHGLARAYLKDGRVARAVELLEHVVRVRERSLVEHHPTRLMSQHELARAYLEDEQVVRAIELLVHVVRVKERSLAEDHPDRLTSQHTLSKAYWKAGRYQEALVLIEHVVSVESRTLSMDDPSRMVSVDLLAEIQEDIAKLELEKSTKASVDLSNESEVVGEGSIYLEDTIRGAEVNSQD